MTRPELRPLTSVRGIFAWAVVAYHIRLAMVGWAPASVVDAMGHGYLAVDIFFILSGFVIWLNYGDRLSGRAAIADFLVRRLARIWPLHATMLGFGLAVALALLLTGRAIPDLPLPMLPLHLLMIQDWGFSDALQWNVPAWSISAEWAAYLLAPLVALCLSRRPLSTLTLIATAALPLLLLFLLLQGSGERFSISEYGTPRCLGEFFCGAAVSRLWMRWRGDRVAEALCWLVGTLLFASWWWGAPETLALPFAFATLLLALALGAERPRHILSGRAIHWLGEISYATYLSHYLLFFAFKLAFVRDAGNVPPGQIAAYLLIVLVASAGLYHLVERPAQRTILRAWRARRTPTPQGTPASA